MGQRVKVVGRRGFWDVEFLYNRSGFVHRAGLEKRDSTLIRIVFLEIGIIPAASHAVLSLSLDGRQDATMKPQTLLASVAASLVLVSPLANSVPMPIDLNTWTKEGAPANGNWNVSADGSNVLQTINGDPTYFVSDVDFINTTFDGSFGVETSGDDDYIGFVFGYRSPIAANGDGQDDLEFLLFDWKQGDQSSGGALANEGFAVSRVNGTITDYIPGFWGHCDDNAALAAECAAQGFEVLATDFGADRGWADNTEYDFTLTYQEDRIRITIDGGAFNNEEIFDISGTFQSGRFGFYNYSQPTVRYQGFTEEETPPGPPSVPAPGVLGLVASGLLGVMLLGSRRRKDPLA